MSIKSFDFYRNNRFPRSTGLVAAKLDARLGLDYDVYNAMNHQGQRNTIKLLDANQKLGMLDKMQSKPFGQTLNSFNT